MNLTTTKNTGSFYGCRCATVVGIVLIAFLDPDNMDIAARIMHLWVPETDIKHVYSHQDHVHTSFRDQDIGKRSFFVAVIMNSRWLPQPNDPLWMALF